MEQVAPLSNNIIEFIPRSGTQDAEDRALFLAAQRFSRTTQAELDASVSRHPSRLFLAARMLEQTNVVLESVQA